jgi:aspartate ammonia-lyase
MAAVRRERVDYGIGTVTAWNPVIGYDRAAELAAEAKKTGRGTWSCSARRRS